MKSAHLRASPAKMTSSDDYLPLSGIQHFSFCRRQWALIHLEQQWHENVLTALGRIEHEVAHDETRVESRGRLLISRGMRVISHRLRLQGACDTVEFRQDDTGIPLPGKTGLWQPYPVEYKHGRPGVNLASDRLQLCAQAMCLEEMLACDIPEGALFYQSTRRREAVAFDENLRNQVRKMAEEMNQAFDRGHTPRVRPKAGCKSCSLKDICLPKLIEKRSAQAYVHQAIAETRLTDE